MSFALELDSLIMHFFSTVIILALWRVLIRLEKKCFSFLFNLDELSSDNSAVTLYANSLRPLETNSLAK